jgi:glycosyltransferase involved in cell wall biosynthesis
MHLAPHRRRHAVEIIVSDDSSRDGSATIAGQLADLLVTNPGEPRGAARARNRGAGRARGGILVFIDADILIHEPRSFFQAVRHHLADPGVVAATSACMVYPWEATRLDDLFHRGYTRYLQLLNHLGVAVASGWCQIVRREAFFEVGGYDPAFNTGQDVDLFYRLKAYGKTRLYPDLMIHESPRRYRKVGLFRLVWKWFLNGLSVYFLRRPYLHRYPPVR